MRSYHDAVGFMFDFMQIVEIRISNEFGEVRGRAQFIKTERQYLIHYKAADGRAMSSWFDESLLKPVEDELFPGCPVYSL